MNKYFRYILYCILMEFSFSSSLDIYFASSGVKADKSIYFASSLLAADVSVYFASSVLAADVSYYITENKSSADIIINIVSSESEADKSIYFASSLLAADKSIYFASSVLAADVSVYLASSVLAADKSVYINTGDKELIKIIIALLSTNTIIPIDKNNNFSNNSHQNSYSQNSCLGNYQDSGKIIKTDVCGMGNVIIETTDGWYIAAEWYGGSLLYEGDIVCGKMKTFGFQEIYSPNRNINTKFWIEDYETNISSAYDELCD